MTDKLLGITVLPDDVAAKAGYHLVVADTVNHTLRGINLDTETVTTIAGLLKPLGADVILPTGGGADIEPSGPAATEPAPGFTI